MSRKWIVIGLGLALIHSQQVRAAGAARPNFIVIMAEAQGWSSTSTPMDDRIDKSKSDMVLTPSLDRLCREGMRFANAYAASPRCTPSRAALFTGKSPAQLHMTYIGDGRKEDAENTNRQMIPPNASIELPQSEVTIAKLLKNAGYATAHFGKWHVGKADPSKHGFDESDGATTNAGPGNNRTPNPAEGYGMAERGASFIAKQAAAGKPFYLQLSHYGGKNPEDALKETYAAVAARNKSKDDKLVGFAAVAEDQDKALATVLKKLDELSIAKNTYIIYTADHGAPGRKANSPLTNGKGSVWEGGVRVPLIIRGPGVRGGACSHVRASGVDLLPTMVELAGINAQLPNGVEGGSLASVLRNGGSGEVKRVREEFIIHFPHYDHDNDGPASAIMLGDYKLIHVYGSEVAHLFDLSKDPFEQKDLAKQMPEKVADLEKRLAAYLKTVNAQMATPNSKYNPKASPELIRPAQAPELLKPQPPAASAAATTQPALSLFRTQVPQHPLDVILARPTKDSITVSLLAYQETQAQIVYGKDAAHLDANSNLLSLKNDEPQHILLTDLAPNTRYHYQVLLGKDRQVAQTGEFQTARPRGSQFVFTLQADSHLDMGTIPQVYTQTLRNALADHPDFHLELGDTFMNDKYPRYTDAHPQYIAQRYYFGLMCHSAPLFFVLGNHDGEQGWRGRESDGMSEWSNGMRRKYFANPFPDGFYTGNQEKRLENYYAWEWGDALFIVLDPFWYTTSKPRGQEADNWRRTLGKTQYDWLKATLDKSGARWKFVFIHHLVGGLDKEGRGGSEAAPLYEWGGRSSDGRNDFAAKRAGWAAPIHELLVQAKATAVFHGHDHLYARQELDGIAYIEVPQPSHPATNNALKMAKEYGYNSGTILGSPGHVRVSVSGEQAKLEFVRCVPGSDRPAQVADEVVLQPPLRSR